MSEVACGGLHGPETFYDDIIASDELVVGESQEYCIQAFKTTLVDWEAAESKVMAGKSYHRLSHNTLY
jgi:hypothetical protein